MKVTHWLMPDHPPLLIAFVFALGGLVKGVVGLGLPTVTMGLLAMTMPSLQAAALLIVPSLITNVWQMLAGPALRPAFTRLWPMLLAVCLGTWSGRGLMDPSYAGLEGLLLGIALLVYALLGLSHIRFHVSRRGEPIAGPVVGLVTGVITAATGVFVIPAVPYLYAIGLEKDELVQALGLAFTVSTIALAINIGATSSTQQMAALGVPSAIALGAALAGMAAGQALRDRLSPERFRQVFFAGLAVLGGYLALRSASSFA
jgi:uncharacterized membrane protein YfcA